MTISSGNLPGKHNLPPLLQENKDISIRIQQYARGRIYKHHCKFAGEGIEYSWGCSKNEYRGKPINLQWKKEYFRQTVRDCLLRDVLTTERVQKFSARARAYMLAYLALERNIDTSTASMNTAETSNSAVVKIEKMVKQFKTHRCALDFDGGFIKSTLLTS